MQQGDGMHFLRGVREKSNFVMRRNSRSRRI